MKQQIQIKILTLLSLLLLCACGGDGDSGTEFTTESLTVKDREVVMGADERTQFVAVEANCPWTARLSNAWENLTANTSVGGGNIKHSC